MKEYYEKTYEEVINKMKCCHTVGITNGQIFVMLDVLEKIKREWPWPTSLKPNIFKAS